VASIPVFLPGDAPAWFAAAACRGENPEQWFTPGRDAEAAAVAVCATCPVQVECLSHALRHGEEHGVWGGKTEAERAQIRRRARQTGRRRRG
jgi:WhiB family redox-sensing transcriptional regulator